MTVTAFRFPDARLRFNEAMTLLNDPTVRDPYSRVVYWQVLKRSWQMIRADKDAVDMTPSDCPTGDAA